MDKNEESNLLELQEMALKHRSAKHHATYEQKSMIVRQYLQNHVPVAQLSRDFGVCTLTIHRWINAFASGKMKIPPEKSNGTSDIKQNPPNMSKKSLKPVESEAEELARLREENKRLAEALKMAEWMNHAKDVMIDEAEKTFKIPIRKKSGAKQ
ncbi:transposase [Xylanibacter ruminicola]|jgi:transposase-like protein|uniref:Transposase n=2 Tax=Xylanibacter ruminicola TaxID=839 RepID=A0A1M6Z0K9_XYLRU|nr:transposase [Xylanibacter ruminicola]SHL23967.1 Transposase [Xylanibacter ruminicola]